MIPLKKPGDYDMYYRQFMNNLDLQIDNTNKILNATDIGARTGYTPAPIEDNRTIREKLQDSLKLKQDIRKGLMSLTDGNEAQEIINGIRDDGELVFLAQHLPEIIKTVKPRYQYGILAPEFLTYLREYRETYDAAHGVDFGSNKGLLDRIEGLITRLPQQADIDNMIRNINNVIAAVEDSKIGILEDLHDQMIAAEERNDARAIRQIEVIKEQMEGLITEQMNELKQTMMEYNESMGRFEEQLSKIGQDVSTISTPELNEIVEKLRALPNIEEFVKGFDARFNSILETINRGDFVEMGRKMDELKSEVEKYNAALDITKIKGSIQMVEGWKPMKWSDLKETTEVLNVLNYLALTKEVIERYNLLSIGNDLLRTASQAFWDLLARFESNFTTSDNFHDLISFVGYAVNRLKDEENRNKRETEKARKEGRDPVLFSSSIYSLFSPNSFRDRKALNTWLSNNHIKDIMEQMRDAWRMSDIQPAITPVEGSGMRKREPIRKTAQIPGRYKVSIRGRGMDNERIRYEKIRDEDIDQTLGVKPTPRYVSLGKYFINHHKLINDNVFSLKTKSGAGASGFSSVRVSDNFTKVIDKMIKNENPSYDMLNRLTKDEQEYLHKVAKKANILDRFNVPTPDKSREEREYNEFMILKGQIMAGNDNEQLVKKFKGMLVKMADSGMITRQESNAIVNNLTRLGY